MVMTVLVRSHSESSEQFLADQWFSITESVIEIMTVSVTTD